MVLLDSEIVDQAWCILAVLMSAMSLIFWSELSRWVVVLQFLAFSSCFFVRSEISFNSFCQFLSANPCRVFNAKLKVELGSFISSLLLEINVRIICSKTPLLCVGEGSLSAIEH